MPRHPRLFIPRATYHVYCRFTRIEFATLGASRYGIRSTEVARFIQNHPTSVARWISLGLRKQIEDPSFRDRIDDIDRRISWSAQQSKNAMNAKGGTIVRQGVAGKGHRSRAMGNVAP